MVDLNFRELFPDNYKMKVDQIVSQAQVWLEHSTLDNKFELNTKERPVMTIDERIIAETTKEPFYHALST